MLTITVAAVILGVGIPNLTQFIRNNRMTSAANDVLAALHMARTEAVKRRAWTVMCMSANPNDATPTCTAGGRGWVVFIDDADPTAPDANDANLVVNNGEEVLLRHDTPPDTITLLTAPNGNSGYIAFTASGFSRAVAAGTPLRSIRMCDSRGNVAVYGADNSAARAITISQTGRPQVTRLVADITAVGGC
jgi:type IV fimbrial biogenesis protein FimT